MFRKKNALSYDPLCHQISIWFIEILRCVFVLGVRLLLHGFPVPSRAIDRVRRRSRFKVAAKKCKSRVDHEDDLANAIYQPDRIEKVGIPAANIHPQVPEDGRKE